MFEIVSKYRRSDMLMSPHEIEGVIFTWKIPRRARWKYASAINTLSTQWVLYTYLIVRVTVEFSLSQIYNDKILCNKIK